MLRGLFYEFLIAEYYHFGSMPVLELRTYNPRKNWRLAEVRLRWPYIIVEHNRDIPTDILAQTYGVINI